MNMSEIWSYIWTFLGGFASGYTLKFVFTNKSKNTKSTRFVSQRDNVAGGDIVAGDKRGKK